MLSLDLHEDYEACGFYCYEPRAQPDGLLGPAIVRAVTDAGLPHKHSLPGYDLDYTSKRAII